MPTKLSNFLPISGVYKITCLANQRIYIGKSNNIRMRALEHVKHILSGKHSCKELISDFLSFGAEAFEHELLFECSESELLQRELETIITMLEQGHSLYNKLVNSRGWVLDGKFKGRLSND